MERFLCVHGHFYQPPRENAWLETIELQDSAAPYHDWNERITAECYAPNAASRILDGEGYIRAIVNNYASISFNVGPTLMAWMETAAPEVYAAILEADRVSAERFDGHGSAMAQAYNHMILPLGTRRDKVTQIRWGIRDFEHRFGRRPEGMWLPETAVDLESLELMAAEGIRFTILAPHQARRVRRLGRPWRDVSGGRIDPTRPYECRLPGGGRIVLFFYDGPVSRAVAFERLLSSGEAFAQRLLSIFDDARTWDQLAHIATDGETYGHHHRFGDMALAYALHLIREQGWARLTNYAAYLASHPPEHQVEIVEHTSWSCAHGVERWRSDCGCNTGMHPGWTQAWRRPLRDALDWLRDALAPHYAEAAGALLRDPWAARDDYISVILDRSPRSVEAFFARHARAPLDHAAQVRALKLLELQRHAMLMYTSCGWFFDELSGIETTQVLQYAARTLQLAADVLDLHLEEPFLERLAAARSNLPELGDGREVYRRFVAPAQVDLPQVVAHFAVSALFQEYPPRARIAAFTVEQEDRQVETAGRARLAVGRVRVISEITWEAQTLAYAVLHLGDHNVHGGVGPAREEATAEAFAALRAAFARGDLPEVIRQIDQAFPKGTYGLRHLFKDERRKVLGQILDATLEDAEGHYRRIYEQHAALMAFLRDLNAPLPDELRTALHFVLRRDLARALAQVPPDLGRIETLVREAQAWGVPLDGSAEHAGELGFAAQRTLEALMDVLRHTPADLEALARVADTAALFVRLPFFINLWQTQNRYYELLQSVAPRIGEHLPPEEAERWTAAFRALGETLKIRTG